MMNIREEEMKKAVGGVKLLDLIVGDRPIPKFNFGDYVWVIADPDHLQGYVRGREYHNIEGWYYDVVNTDGYLIGCFAEAELT